MTIFDKLRKFKAFNEIRYKMINKRLLLLEITNVCMLGYIITKNLF
jgi:hypothetical protein